MSRKAVRGWIRGTEIVLWEPFWKKVLPPASSTLHSDFAIARGDMIDGNASLNGSASDTAVSPKPIVKVIHGT
ncbi:MAG TPA: hypothetical protein VGL71_05265, partial [Urbifossiella sp.]